MDQLATSVSRDPGLCARALDIFGADHPGPARLPTLSGILDSIGRRTLQAVAVSSRVCAVSEEEEVLRCRRDALRCALIARGLAEAIDYPAPDEAYIGGLLHNIDQLILLSRAGEADERPGDSVMDDIERSGDLGAAMIASWGLNPVLADAVRYCREPEDYVLDAHPLVRLVHVAAACVRDPQRVLSETIDHRLPGIGATTLSGLLSRVAGELEDSTALQADSQQRRRLDVLLREMALLASLGRPGAADAAGTESWSERERDIRLLTGIRKACCFVLDESGERLRPASGVIEDDPLSELAIRVSGGHSLLSRTLEQNRIVHSFDPDTPALNVADRQIAARLGATGLLCVPLIGGDRRAGVLVLGIEQRQLRRLLARRHLLQRLGSALQPTAEAAGAVSPDAVAEEQRLRHIVHEINNPLSIVRNYLKVLGLRLDRDHPAASVLDVIEEELLRASSLVQQIVETTDEGAQRKLMPVRINALVADLMRLAPYPGEVRVVLALDENLPPILTDANALKQILGNLVANALEAMAGSGRLTIRTRDWVRVDGTPGVELEVSDTGPGIPQEVQEKLFSPVATTKGPDHSGLGLSIVKRLVDALDGSIRVRSTPHDGTRFQVMLPRRVADAATSRAPTEPATDCQRG